MRVIVIGSTGHVGSYLVPRLVAAGHEVISMTRGQRPPYHPDPAWGKVREIVADRAAEDAAGSFRQRVRDLEPDVVIDMICFTPESASQMVEALRGRVQHFLHCGTIWVHGPSAVVPTTEEQPRKPFGEYGIRKAAIESFLLEEARERGFPATVLHPGHIVGPGWAPLNPAGHFELVVFERLACGEEVAIPHLGLETVHHVHADDVAKAFEKALARRDDAIGESFHVVSPAALTLRGYAEAVAGWFGSEPRLRFLPWEEWTATVSARDAAYTWDHIAHSPSCSIAKAARLLDYTPRYTSLQAVFESLEWLIQAGTLKGRAPKDRPRLRRTSWLGSRPETARGCLHSSGGSIWTWGDHDTHHEE